MKLETAQDDPLSVLSSTKQIVENAEFISLNEEKVAEVSQKIKERFAQGLDTGEMGYTLTGDLENDIQLIFIEDAVNFCFWAGKNQVKWQVKKDDSSLTEGGWYGLQTCFEKAISSGMPVLDANYLKSISDEDVKKLFLGANDMEIPLLKERADNLREAGKVLIEKFDGKFINAVKQAEYNAIKLTKIIINNFPSFRDASNFNGKKVFFLKRAQICSSDIDYILRAKGRKLSNLDKLTAFADYKLPQILRMFGVIFYNEDLSEKVDNYVEIIHDSQEEIEIRATTIWAVELLRQELKDLTAKDIDNTIWLMSQSLQKEAKPYHRTRTIFY